MKNKVGYCPVEGWGCPYFKKGLCTMYPKSNPVEECDDFYLFWEEYIEKDSVIEMDEEEIF